MKVSSPKRRAPRELIRRLPGGLRRRTASFSAAALLYLTNHVVSRVLVSRLRLWWYRSVMKLVVGAGSSIAVDLRVSQRGNIRIGRHTVINNHCRFDNRGPIVIGNSVSVSYGTMILTAGHLLNSPDFESFTKGVRIDDFVWICANAIVQPGVHLGEGAVVLTGSVVARDVGPYEVVGGNPARVVGTRTPGMKYKLRWDPVVPFFG